MFCSKRSRAPRQPWRVERAVSLVWGEMRSHRLSNTLELSKSQLPVALGAQDIESPSTPQSFAQFVGAKLFPRLHGSKGLSMVRKEPACDFCGYLAHSWLGRQDTE